jgi:hypothetical protein
MEMTLGGLIFLMCLAFFVILLIVCPCCYSSGQKIGYANGRLDGLREGLGVKGSPGTPTTPTTPAEHATEF